MTDSCGAYKGQRTTVKKLDDDTDEVVHEEPGIGSEPGVVVHFYVKRNKERRITDVGFRADGQLWWYGPTQVRVAARFLDALLLLEVFHARPQQQR